MRRTFLFNTIAVVVFLTGIVLFFQYAKPSNPAPQEQLSAASVSQATSTVATTTATSTVSNKSSATSTTATVSKVAKIASNKAIIAVATTSSDEIARVQNPYATPAESWATVNTDARGALVNILCAPQSSSSLDPISGSGVIIDPRGVILTNAHVAQYVLLSESPEIDLNCVIRTGSPASATWSASVMYIPPIWVNQHASEITEEHPSGTGEHDYALLYITGSVDGAELPSQFPYLPVDTRPAIAFPGDQALVASYPAELIGGIAAQYDLYADTSITTIQQLMTFGTTTPDVLSLGGVIEAQAGSSGGAVVNAWGYLVGLIATTSSGTTTAQRDLRSISLSYINADLETQTGESLSTLLAKDPMTQIQEFDSSTAPALLEDYLNILGSNQSTQ